MMITKHLSLFYHCVYFYIIWIFPRWKNLLHVILKDIPSHNHLFFFHSSLFLSFNHHYLSPSFFRIHRVIFSRSASHLSIFSFSKSNNHIHNRYIVIKRKETFGTKQARRCILTSRPHSTMLLVWKSDLSFNCNWISSDALGQRIKRSKIDNNLVVSWWVYILTKKVYSAKPTYVHLHRCMNERSIVFAQESSHTNEKAQPCPESIHSKAANELKINSNMVSRLVYISTNKEYTTKPTYTHLHLDVLDQFMFSNGEFVIGIKQKLGIEDRG